MIEPRLEHIDLASFPEDEARFLLPGPAGDLETATALPKQPRRAITIIICHPHPLHGGTMDNKVVTTVARTFNQMGFASLRFNYRGVNQSEGHYADAIGETDDLLAVINWVRKVQSTDSIWLAGFSFGAYVAANAADKLSHFEQLKQLISIAPAVHHMDYTPLKPACPWLVIQPDADEIVPPKAVYAWAKTHKPTPRLIRVKESSHFFHGKLIPLRELLEKEFSKA